MIEPNIIKCQIVPIHPDNLEAMSDEHFDTLAPHIKVSKEGVRVLLCSREPSEEEIMENWVKFRELKAQDGGS